MLLKWYITESSETNRYVDKRRLKMGDKGQNFVKRKLTGADFSRANLKWARFGKAVLINCNFDGANCRRADFRKADLTGASFRNTRLQKANFCGAVLRDTDFEGARLDDAEFDEDVKVWLITHGYISNHCEQSTPDFTLPQKPQVET
jgi:uncharacterized protein YjbI with pentapeptide repeats